MFVAARGPIMQNQLLGRVDLFTRKFVLHYLYDFLIYFALPEKSGLIFLHKRIRLQCLWAPKHSYIIVLDDKKAWDTAYYMPRD